MNTFKHLSQSMATPPPPTSFAHLSFPAPHILLVTLSRPASRNCINAEGHHELANVWAWLDREPALRVGIVTGAGKAFCAGADLKGEGVLFCFVFFYMIWWLEHVRSKPNFFFSGFRMEL